MDPQQLLTATLILTGAGAMAFAISSTVQVLRRIGASRYARRWQALIGIQACVFAGYLAACGLVLWQQTAPPLIVDLACCGAALFIWLAARLSAVTIDELRATRGVAETAGKARSILLANMSHELRTPLNEIIGYSSVLIEESEAEPGHDLWRIRAAGIHLLGMIDALLDHAKLEAGRIDLRPGPVTLPALVNEVADHVRPLAERNRNQLGLSLAPDLPPLVTDEARLRQILINLLTNACTFTEDGLVTLRLSGDSGELYFTVIDTGIGISHEQQALLFQPFAQATGHTVPRYGSTGLGLSIARQLARLMGGDVSVRSAPGRGSAFTLRLPAASLRASAHSHEDHLGGLGQPAKAE